MAKAVVQPADEMPFYVWWQAALLGVGLGVVFWVLMALLDRYVMRQFVCDSVTVACSAASTAAGNIATILVAAGGLFAAIRIQMFRPLIVVIAVALALWGMGGWVSGLAWWEQLGWAALLYGIAYLLFSWITNFTRTVWVLIVAAVVVVVARVIFTLVA
jgi:hypothetical protein